MKLFKFTLLVLTLLGLSEAKNYKEINPIKVDPILKRDANKAVNVKKGFLKGFLSEIPAFSRKVALSVIKGGIGGITGGLPGISAGASAGVFSSGTKNLISLLKGGVKGGIKSLKGYKESTGGSFPKLKV